VPCLHSSRLCFEFILTGFVGVVYSLGRKEYGRLGLGTKNLEEKSKPTIIPKLQSKKCVHVECGTAVSYAVASDGACPLFFMFLDLVYICRSTFTFNLICFCH